MHGGKIHNKQKINKPHTTTKTHKKKGNYSILFLHTFGYCSKWQISTKLIIQEILLIPLYKPYQHWREFIIFLKNTSLEVTKC